MTQAKAQTPSPEQARIDELEIKAAFQEQLITDLNDELVKHGQRIAELEQQLTRLVENLKNPQEDTEAADQRPPHY